MRRVIALLPVALAGAAALAAAQDSPTTSYQGADARVVGVRPTGVGLPRIGARETVGAGEIAGALRAYHDSGTYAADAKAVVAAAGAYLTRRIDQNAAPVVQVCRKRYVRLRRSRGRPLYRRAAICTVESQRGFRGRPAIVLDIDETALSNYDSLVATNFTAAGLALPALTGTATAIEPTRELFDAAKAESVAVFFITGRPESVRAATEANLERAGYEGWDGLAFRPGGVGTVAYKSGERARIEAEGYDIVLNLGDQESDLEGGHADRSFKLPNPFYVIGG